MLDHDWNATLVLDGLTQPNGLDWSPARDALYLVETQARQVVQFEWDAATGAIGQTPTILVDRDAFSAFPDGLCVDARGHLWIAEFGGGAVHEFTSAGRRVRTIPMPTLQPTSCVRSWARNSTSCGLRPLHSRSIPRTIRMRALCSD
jgi:sugar lactone lactonase YvrE